MPRIDHWQDEGKEQDKVWYTSDISVPGHNWLTLLAKLVAPFKKDKADFEIGSPPFTDDEERRDAR